MIRLLDSSSTPLTYTRVDVATLRSFMRYASYVSYASARRFVIDCPYYQLCYHWSHFVLKPVNLCLDLKVIWVRNYNCPTVNVELWNLQEDGLLASGQDQSVPNQKVSGGSSKVDTIGTQDGASGQVPNNVILHCFLSRCTVPKFAIHEHEISIVRKDQIGKEYRNSLSVDMSRIKTSSPGLTIFCVTKCSYKPLEHRQVYDKCPSLSSFL